jgi:hypothetical protein
MLGIRCRARPSPPRPLCTHGQLLRESSCTPPTVAVDASREVAVFANVLDELIFWGVVAAKWTFVSVPPWQAGANWATTGEGRLSIGR